MTTITSTLSPASALERLLGTVGEAMTAEPICARTEWPLTEAVLSMDRAGVNRVPVVDAAGRPVGILTRDDVLRILGRSIRQGAQPRKAIMYSSHRP